MDVKYLIGCLILCTILGGCGSETSDIKEKGQDLNSSIDKLEGEKSETAGILESSEENPTHDIVQNFFGDTYSITIDEAQENKKELTIHGTNEEIPLYIYDNVIYGLHKNIALSDLGQKPFKQIVGVNIGAILINEDGGRYFTGSELDHIYENMLFTANENAHTETWTKYGKTYFYYDTKEEMVKSLLCFEMGGLAKDVVKVKGVKQIICLGSEKKFAILKEDGTVKIYVADEQKDVTEGKFVSKNNGLDVKSWSGIKYITACNSNGNYIVGIKEDGTLVVTGDDYPDEIVEWNDLVDIQVSHYGAVGLNKDGTVICSSGYDYCNEIIKDWNCIKVFRLYGRDIVAISEDGHLYSTTGLWSIFDPDTAAYKYEDGKYVEYLIDEDWYREKSKENENDTNVEISLEYFHIAE